MALAEILKRRIRARKDQSDGEEEVQLGSRTGNSDTEDDVDGSEAVADETSSSTGRGEEESYVQQSSTSPTPTSPIENLTTVSFGALAAAQATLGKRKRPSSTTALSTPKSSHDTSTHTSFPEASERHAGKKDTRHLPRTSKHAPAELSSKKAVSRKREVVAVTKREVRDPRFEALSGLLDEERVKRNYSFLTDYQASEMKSLKDTIRTTREPSTKETLKRALLSMESRQKAQQAKDLQQEIIRDHRTKEKELIKQGKRPFYLKRGEQKKLALVRKFEGMGDKRVERVIERRRQKKAGKERRAMPEERRGAAVP
ncbi:rRNA biogenesis protein rrp36 [Lignoscripta atroalba]|nr:rRNA biogenesis protein rrp36 [Lignoscripta atroalba]